MFERPVLIFSEYCNHCATFINTLIKHPAIFESFVKVNIDVEPHTQRRPQIFHDMQEVLNFKISEVPCIIINKGEYILSGVEAFKWLEHEIKNSDKVLEGFNPNEMGSFSDSYSKFGSNELYDATPQSYRFVNSPEQKIHTPPEDSVASQDDYNKKQRERDQTISFNHHNNNNNFSSVQRNTPEQMTLSEMINARNQFHAQQVNAPPQFNHQPFNNKNYSNSNGQGNAKQKEMDKRYQELLLEREQITPVQKQRSVNFATGQIS